MKYNYRLTRAFVLSLKSNLLKTQLQESLDHVIVINVSDMGYHTWPFASVLTKMKL